MIDDASEYGKGLADQVNEALGAKVVGTDTIDPAATDFSATVTKVKDAAPDAVFFGGYYAAAGLLSKQLRDAGVTAILVFGDGVLDPGYIEAGGDATEGAIITCPCAPIDKIEGGEDFASAYKDAFGADAGTYSAEAYDSANFFLAGHRLRRPGPRLAQHVCQHRVVHRHHQDPEVRRARRGLRRRDLRLHSQGRQDRFGRPDPIGSPNSHRTAVAEAGSDSFAPGFAR